MAVLSNFHNRLFEIDLGYQTGNNRDVQVFVCEAGFFDRECRRDRVFIYSITPCPLPGVSPTFCGDISQIRNHHVSLFFMGAILS